MLPDLSDGDELTWEWLNELRALAIAAQPSLDGSSGVGGYVGSFTAMHAPRSPGRWAKLVTDLGGGLYDVIERIPSGLGTWEDGITFEAREPNGTTGLEVGVPPYVWCTYNRAYDEWTFEVTVCV